MARTKKEITYHVTVRFVPHPNPQRAINLMADLVLKELLAKEAGNNEQGERGIKHEQNNAARQTDGLSHPQAAV